jgi:HK97 family phage portal protein
LYERQLWVYVLVNKLAGAEARLPLPVYRRGSDDSRERDSEHPMAKLLANPNPGMSGYTLREWTSSTENIFGEAFWYKRRARRSRKTITGLFPMHPTAMTEESGVWTFDNGSTVIRDIPAADLVHFKRFNPSSQSRGLSPLEPLRSTLENEWHARTATSSFWQRGARPGLFLKHPQNLSEPAQARLRAQVDSMHAGSVNTGSTFLLEEGMEPTPMTLSAEEAQYIETRKLNREEVCAAYDVPPPVVHILDRATFSNITEQMRSMYRDTMGPPLGRHEATIETDLRLAEWPDDDVYAEHLLDQVLRGDFEARQDALAKATHMTIAEKRRVENLPFIEGTDRIFMNTATLPLDAIDANADLARAQASTPQDPPALALVRSVLGRLSWQQTLADVDPVALGKGLPAEQALGVHEAFHTEVKAGGTVAGFKDRLRSLLSSED